MKVSSIITALALSVGCNLASATQIITDHANPAAAVPVTSSHTYWHDITEHGFLVGDYSLANAFITVFLSDPAGGDEQVQIKFGDQSINPSGNNDVPGNVGYIIALSAASMADLAFDGLLRVTLTSNSGSYYFTGSTLEVEVPEPFTLALMAVGLAAAGAVTRRKDKA